MGEKRGKRVKICPRCGERYSWLERRRVNDNIYYYAVHEERVEGRRKITKCYLGPEFYTYATRTHLSEGLVLRGLVEENRILDYLEQILKYIEERDFEPERAEEIARRLEETARKLRLKNTPPKARF